jgi:hypothetical protein
MFFATAGCISLRISLHISLHDLRFLQIYLHISAYCLHNYSKFAYFKFLHILLRTSIGHILHIICIFYCLIFLNILHILLHI